MRAIVVGMGVQGKKRKVILGKKFVYSVDKFIKSDFKKLSDVPKDHYDTVFVCVPDKEKTNIVNYCIDNKKHILVEKPFLSKNNKIFKNFQKRAIRKKIVFYTAYNHRFEPIIVKMMDLIKSKKLGKIYKCRMFYGNGTSMLVKKSKWRDKGKGVLTDIGSHLIDICFYWFGTKINSLKIVELNRFENKAPDHAIVSFKIKKIKFELEMTLCMWKNSFTCDVLASKGSAHLNSLCKWGQNSLIYRKRKYPSGLPYEKKYSFKKGDPTWKSEFLYFKNLIKKNSKTDLKKDRLINNCFLKLK
jgi:predicted dehydrogenase